MSLNTLQEYTRIAKYAKYLPEENRRETEPEYPVHDSFPGLLEWGGWRGMALCL